MTSSILKCAQHGRTGAQGRSASVNRTDERVQSAIAVAPHSRHGHHANARHRVRHGRIAARVAQQRRSCGPCRSVRLLSQCDTETARQGLEQALHDRSVAVQDAARAGLHELNNAPPPLVPPLPWNWRQCHARQPPHRGSAPGPTPCAWPVACSIVAVVAADVARFWTSGVDCHGTRRGVIAIPSAPQPSPRATFPKRTLGRALPSPPAR